jgi:hypothetical protein
MWYTRRESRKISETLSLEVYGNYFYVGITCQSPKYHPSCDILRDCRKSPKMAILAISHVIKSITYKHKIHKFRVFRQSLRVSQVCTIHRYHKDITKRGVNNKDCKELARPQQEYTQEEQRLICQIVLGGLGILQASILLPNMCKNFI